MNRAVSINTKLPVYKRLFKLSDEKSKFSLIAGFANIEKKFFFIYSKIILSNLRFDWVLTGGVNQLNMKKEFLFRVDWSAIVLIDWKLILTFFFNFYFLNKWKLMREKI